jgi:gluconolactonase
MFRVMAEITEVTSGLRFPEGPIAMDDGSVVLVEIEAERLTRHRTAGGDDRRRAGVAQRRRRRTALSTHNATTVAGGTSSAGVSSSRQRDPAQPGGKIRSISPGQSSTSTESTGGHCGRNDLVFGLTAGSGFTTTASRGPPGRRVQHLLRGPNGSSVRRSSARPRARTASAYRQRRTVYWAETCTVRVLRRTVTGPGEVEWAGTYRQRRFTGNLPAATADSLAVDGDGNVCIASSQQRHHRHRPTAILDTS